MIWVFCLSLSTVAALGDCLAGIALVWRLAKTCRDELAAMCVSLLSLLDIKNIVLSLSSYRLAARLFYRKVILSADVGDLME